MLPDRRFERPAEAIARALREGAEFRSLVLARLATAPMGVLDYAEVVTPQGSITTEVNLTGLTLTVDIPANRYIRILGYSRIQSSLAATRFIIDVKESTTYIGKCGDHEMDTALVAPVFYGGPILVAPSAGVHTYRLTARRISGSGVGATVAGTVSPDYIMVEDIGPV